MPEWSTIASAGTERYGPLVYGLVRALRPYVVCETGCYDGYLTSWTVRGLIENGMGHAYAIDDWSGDFLTNLPTPSRNRFLANMSAFGPSMPLTLLAGDSRKVSWPSSVDMAILDGSHDVDVVRFECDLALDRGCRCFVLHDIQSRQGPQEVFAALRASLASPWNALEFGFDGGCGVLVDSTIL